MYTGLSKKNNDIYSCPSFPSPVRSWIPHTSLDQTNGTGTSHTQLMQQQ